jgi:hypothetical protein
VRGKLGPGVTSKDVILHIIGVIGTAGGTGNVIEFCGESIRGLSMEARMSICNMAIEAGARAGMIAPDDVTFEYLKGRPLAPTGAEWDKVLHPAPAPALLAAPNARETRPRCKGLFHELFPRGFASIVCSVGLRLLNVFRLLCAPRCVATPGARRHRDARHCAAQAVAYWRTLGSDAGAKYDTEVTIEAKDIAPTVTWGTSPQDTAPITGRVPDPAKEADPLRRAAMERSLKCDAPPFPRPDPAPATGPSCSRDPPPSRSPRGSPRGGGGRGATLSSTPFPFP